MTKNKTPPKKKAYFIKTTSKRTGAIILIAFVSILVLSISFLFYAKDFADKQKLYEDQWRLMSCEDMKEDYQKDPYLWKITSMKDMNCITVKEYNNELAKWTK